MGVRVPLHVAAIAYRGDIRRRKKTNTKVFVQSSAKRLCNRTYPTPTSVNERVNEYLAYVYFPCECSYSCCRVNVHRYI